MFLSLSVVLHFQSSMPRNTSTDAEIKIQQEQTHKQRKRFLNLLCACVCVCVCVDGIAPGCRNVSFTLACENDTTLLDPGGQEL